MRIMSRLMVGNKENTPVLEKSEKSYNQRRILPPNVSGNSIGFLDLSFDKIQWNVTTSADLSARVIWWGESYDEATSINISPSSRNCLTYSICTNTHLFRKYLSSCEAIEVQFSTRTAQGRNRQIGTAFISIPETLLNQDTEYFAPKVCTSTHKIFSPKNTTLGMLKATMKLVLFEDLTKGNPLSEKNETRAFTKDYLNYKKEPVLRCESVASSSKVWSFLRGREMTPRDEAKTLRELMQSSPANSVIEAMDEELTWKLRDFYSRRSLGMKSEKAEKCHNPGGGAEKEHSNNVKENSTDSERSNGGGSQSQGSSNGGSDKKKENTTNGKNEDLQLAEKENIPDEQEEEEYQGVFYIGGFRNQHPHNRVPNVFAIAKSVSNVDDCLLKTHLSDQNLFINYLKVFPIRIEESHLDATMKQGTLTVELWTRSQAEGANDSKMGTVSVGLHPFFVAFRHEIVRKRLFDLSMPVIALDGWAMVQGLDGASIGQLEVILAMGTKRQVDFFVQSKQLLDRRMEPQMVMTPSSSSSGRSAETATTILSSFLDNLSQQIAASKQRQQQEGEQSKEAPKKGELRKTSDLLDALHKSLASPPSEMMHNLFSAKSAINGEGERMGEGVASATKDVTDFNSGKEQLDQEYVKISLEIESAMHLPKVSGGGGSSSRESSTSNKLKKGVSGRQKEEGNEEPSPYVTFEARIIDESQPDIVDSVEGKVYSTKVVEKSSNPTWDTIFEVEIPKDLLTHPQKYFIIKIWRKRETCTDMKPTPMQDVVVGFCTVDLKVLTAGLPEIAGCYNIVYFDGKCNGQLQIKLKPLEEIQHKDVLDRGEMHVGGVERETIPMMLDLSIGQDLSLSRTLKRKFTELDEITQRLRARLNDVTSSELISSDDEFENYLNTSVDEVDEEKGVEKGQEEGDVVDAVKDDFNWLGNLTEMQRQFVEIDRQLQRNSQTLNELLDRNGLGGPIPGPSGSSSARGATSSVNNLYTNGGGGGDGGASTTVESLETALKDAVLNDRPSTT